MAGPRSGAIHRARGGVPRLKKTRGSGGVPRLKINWASPPSTQNNGRPSEERRPPSQQDCKPSSVLRRIGAAAIHLGPRLLRASCDQPEGGPGPCALLFGLAPGGVCPAGRSPGTLVRSYRTVSPLPGMLKADERLQSPSAGLRGRPPAFNTPGGLSLWHFPSRRHAWTLSSTLPVWSSDFPPPDESKGGRPSSWLPSILPRFVSATASCPPGVLKSRRFRFAAAFAPRPRPRLVPI